MRTSSSRKTHTDAIPVTITIIDWDRELLSTERWSELEKCIRQLPQIAHTPNTIVDVLHPEAGTLSIGVAGECDSDNSTLSEPVACVNYVNAAKAPPYLSVVGDSTMSVESDGLVVFRYEQGSWTELPRRNCVSLSKMREIVKHFAFTARLPEWTAWEEL